MFVSMEQVVNGVAKYVNSEFVEKVDGLKKWAVIGAASLAVAKVNSIGETLQKSKVAKTMGVMDDNGQIDIDLFKEHMAFAADSTGPMVQNIPLLGPVTFRKDDIQKLYDFIVNS